MRNALRAKFLKFESLWANNMAPKFVISHNPESVFLTILSSAIAYYDFNNSATPGVANDVIG